MHSFDVEAEIARRPYLPTRSLEFVNFVRTPYYYCFVYIPLLNFLIFVLAGRYILSAILFPY